MDHIATTETAEAFNFSAQVDKDSTANIDSNVVQNDTAQQAAAFTAKAGVLTNTIEQLAAEREQWQATSNEQLYALLQKCYSLYKSMEGEDASATALREELNAYITSKGYGFKKTTHTIAKLIRCVFGVEDRRRMSTYTIVLRTALERNVGVLDVVEFIRNEGGIESIRLGNTANSMTPKQKAQAAIQSVAEQTLGVVSSDAVGKLLDAGKIGTNTVLVGTWQADGSIVIRAVVDSDTALNAALASQYSVLKEAEKAQAAEKTAALIADAKQQAIAAAVASATVAVAV